jgi:hypothetical protein
MRVYRIYCCVALGILFIGLSLLCFSAPWSQVHPAASKALRMPRAAIWSHSDLPGARLDTGELLVEAALIIAFASIVAKIGLGTRSKL